ncbi:MAG: TonB-dependent receptor plug domain-containing protein, partial [Gammaproteobacteria bacterium]|nr:TonB-dependent receptor plug domain-containing protein [Gammaproteobacteria bacterium]
MRVISILERLPLLGFATLAFMCGSSVVSAQEGADQSTGGLEEIIVSARRRAESLQDVPVAVQAFSAQQIENAGIKDFEEIVSRTPGMVFSQSNGLDHEIFIRGIGSDIQGAGADNAIGVFVDGVYMSRNSGSQLGLYDLERVEVLKGPQSLRFGKNIVGGLIHYVTKKPTDEFEGSLEFSYGDYDQVD